MANTVIIDGVRYHIDHIPKSKIIKPVPEKTEDKKPPKKDKNKPDIEIYP